MTTIGFEAARERLLGHEPGLWHRSVHGIDQEQHGVDHRQDALDLAAEIGVARRIDDIDPIAPPAQGGIFREDGDPSFALEIVVSMIRSGAAARSPSVPDCCSRRSTKVVLP